MSVLLDLHIYYLFLFLQYWGDDSVYFNSIFISISISSSISIASSSWDYLNNISFISF